MRYKEAVAGLPSVEIRLATSGSNPTGPITTIGSNSHPGCPFSRVKQTCHDRPAMSAPDPERTWRVGLLNHFAGANLAHHRAMLAKLLGWHQPTEGRHSSKASAEQSALVRADELTHFDFQTARSRPTAASAMMPPGFMLSTIALGIIIVAPRSLVVS